MHLFISLVNTLICMHLVHFGSCLFLSYSFIVRKLSSLCFRFFFISIHMFSLFFLFYFLFFILYFYFISILFLFLPQFIPIFNNFVYYYFNFTDTSNFEHAMKGIRKNFNFNLTYLFKLFFTLKIYFYYQFEIPSKKNLHFEPASF